MPIAIEELKAGRANPVNGCKWYLVPRTLVPRTPELNQMRSLAQQYAGMRVCLAEFERRLEELEAVP